MKLQTKQNPLARLTKSQNEVLFASFLLSEAMCLIFNNKKKNCKAYQMARKTTIWRDTKIIRVRLSYDRGVGIIREIKIVMISMLRILMGKVNNMKEQMSSISKEIRTLRNKIKRKCWVTENNVTEMKNAFRWLISRLNMTKERIMLDF